MYLISQLARAGKLSFRYSVGWLTLSVIGFGGGFLSSQVKPIAEFLGMSVPTLVGLFAIAFLISISIQLSVSISVLQNRNRVMAEELSFIKQTSIRQQALPMDLITSGLNQRNVLVVVPAFNEAKSVGQVVQELKDSSYHVLVIDDGSTDQTSQVAATSGASVIRLPYNLGVGGALRAGFRFAIEHSYHAVVQVDADGQHQTQEITNLIESANSTGAHLVLGSRFTSIDTKMEIGKMRRMVMRVLARSATKATGVTITDATSGFRLIREPLLSQFGENFSPNYLGDTYEALVSAGRAGYRINEIPTAMEERHSGTSTASSIQAIFYTLRVLTAVLLRLNTRLQIYSDDIR